MTTHRRYYFEDPGEWTTGHEQVQRVLWRACEARWWFNEPKVEGEPFSKLSFSFTVSARDQWSAHQRAMKLAKECYIALGKGELKVPEPMWEPLAPHTNRGYWRTPKA